MLDWKLLRLREMLTARAMRIEVDGGREPSGISQSEVSALLMMPTHAKQLLVLGHGAGAGMNHPFMEALAGELAAVGMGTLRYQFPYMEHRRRVPDAPGLLLATVAAAVWTARKVAPSCARTYASIRAKRRTASYSRGRWRRCATSS